MSRRTLKTDDEEGFVRAFKDEVLDTQEMYQVDVRWDIRVTAGRPGLTLHGSATFNDESPLAGHTVWAEFPYPSASVARLHAALYAAAIRLNVGVQNAYRDKQGHYKSEQVD